MIREQQKLPHLKFENLSRCAGRRFFSFSLEVFFETLTDNLFPAQHKRKKPRFSSF